MQNIQRRFRTSGQERGRSYGDAERERILIMPTFYPNEPLDWVGKNSYQEAFEGWEKEVE